MSNESLFHYGKIICLLTYGLDIISGLILTMISGSTSLPLFVMIGAAILLFVILVILGQGYGQKRINQFNLTFFSFTVLYTTYISARNDDAFLLLLLFLIQWQIILLYLNKSLCYELATMQILAVSVLTFITYSYPENYHILGTRQFLICVAGIVFTGWISSIIISFINIRNQQNTDQQQSLDDMLNVVESIYDEARDKVNDKTDFISELALIITDPVKNIIGMNELIISDRSPERIKECTTQINKNADRLLKTADELQMYAQSETGNIIVHTREYSIGDTISEIVKNYILEIRRKGLRFFLNVGDVIPDRVYGDKKLVERIIDAIFSNAVKFTDRGSITINIYSDDSKSSSEMIYLCFEISDTGRGIRERDRDNIFTPFYKPEERYGISGKGTGLGLPLAARFVSVLGGSITLDTEYGHGSVFVVGIPQGIIPEENKKPGEQSGLLLFDKMERIVQEITEEVNNEKNSNSSGECTSEKKNGGSGVDKNADNVSEQKGSLLNENPDMPSIPGISWEVALGFLPTRDILISTLEKTYSLGYETADSLRELFKEYKENGTESSREGFKIKVHAVKSTTRMIGATDISDRAKGLEFAARDGDRALILSGAEKFIDDYIELISSIGEIPEIAAKSKSGYEKYDKDTVLLKLSVIEKAMEDFDMDASDKAMEELRSYGYPANIDILMKELSNSVLNLNGDEAKRIAGNIRQLL